MLFFEILFFVIYIRFLIEWPLQTVIWTILISLLGLGLFMIFIAFITDLNGYNSIVAIIGGIIAFAIGRTLYSAFN